MVAAVLLWGAAGGGAAGAAGVRCISHRGESLDAPENTMAAFRLAVERKADGFECDVYLTKDNEIVCLHDATAKRTAGLDVKPCDATLAELRALDAGSWKDRKFAGERIPTLSEALTLARDNFEIYVEVKCGTEILPRLAEVLAAEPKATPERVRFICFNTNVVQALRQRLPDYRAYWVVGVKQKEDGTVTPSAEEALSMLRSLGAHGIDIQAHGAAAQKLIDKAYVRAIQAAGFSFHVWTVNSVRQAAALAALGVETVTSDCGGVLAALLKPRPAGQPVIAWAFDGGTENGGNGGPLFDAALCGTPAYVAGVSGQALKLDGTNGVARAPFPLPECGTLALWFRPEAFYNFNTVLDNSRSPDQWEMWIAQDGRLRFRMGKESGEVSCDLNALGGPGRWYHLAVTWDAYGTKAARLYVDGVARDSGVIGRWIAPGGGFAIGGGNAGNSRGRGAADEVRVYETALGDAQIRALFDARGRR